VPNGARINALDWIVADGILAQLSVVLQPIFQNSGAMGADRLDTKVARYGDMANARAHRGLQTGLRKCAQNQDRELGTRSLNLFQAPRLREIRTR
jgi:hypothetical protein